MTAAAAPETHLPLLTEIRALPTLPASVPAPEVSYGFNAWGYINTEITINGHTIVFWTEGRHKIVNSDLYTGGPHSWALFLSAEDLQAAMVWSEIMHDRLAVTARAVLIGLSTPDFKANLVTAARG